MPNGEAKRAKLEQKEGETLQAPMHEVKENVGLAEVQHYVAQRFRVERPRKYK